MVSDLKDQPNVMWLDNFSKIYATGFQTTDGGAWRDCLWSGVGIRVFQGSGVDLAIRDGVPAMPDDLFSEAAVSKLTRMMARCDAKFWDRLRNSLVNRYDVRNVPLKPDIDKVEARYVDALKESRDGMKSFYPLRISPINIGSNRGLVKILAGIWEEHKHSHNMSNYQYVTADCNIFWRACRVSKII